MPPSDQKTAEEKKSPGLKPPAITAPKGGGALKGIGEKFSANPVTGTGSMSIPLATSPGRSGFGPSLALSYDSGSGNGPFGFGWSLGLPSITRKTDKGLPRYEDGEADSDVFVLSGAEDLVPVLDAGDAVWEDTVSVPGVAIRRYRPRVEGLFARIERWTAANGDVHWRSITRDNVTTLYGLDAGSRVADPGDASRIFSWLIAESYDDKGNVAVYEYASETGTLYLEKIKYGNTVSRLADPDLKGNRWLFQAVLDYDEGRLSVLPPDPNKQTKEQHVLVKASAQPLQAWTARPDPFSSFRSGFERRTLRRCLRVMMFHDFPELGAEPCLVKATEFDYRDLDYKNPVGVEAELAHVGSTRLGSFLCAVTQSGFVAVPGQDGVYIRKAMPPVDFEYSRAVIQDDVRQLEAGSLENLPAGLGGGVQWIDLDGEGLSGALTEQAGAWYYKPNLGGGRLGGQTLVAAKPSTAALSGGRQQLLDLTGGGRLDLASFRGPVAGYFRRTPEAGWEPHKAFRALPAIDWDEPNLKFLDLDGDGHADVLITEDDAFTWHPSLAEEGFGEARRVASPRDEGNGPALVADDGTQSIYLADMTGDGLTDLVRLRNGEVCYWPNLGYGRFGAKVTMAGAPWFDEPDQFDQKRVRLADIDGSGTTDIIYLGRDGVRLYFNLCGNGWTAARTLKQFPRVDDLSAISTADLLGNGTACLVWSSPLPGDAGRALRFIDLMGGNKPHLLVKVANNLGAETRVTYAASTKFYLEDKAKGRPWITRLTFPVHVVERVETLDRVSGNRFATGYSYRHGYFDPDEREFRGFAFVEQLDTEELSALNVDGAVPDWSNWSAASHVPPVRTRTWYHTGVYLGRDRVSRLLAAEYFREPGLTDQEAADKLLPDTLLPAGLTADEEREACRALKGSMLRQEICALDETARQEIPYSVAEKSFVVRRLQKTGPNRHAVFLTHAGEALTYHYERDASDPRVGHALTLEVDGFGGVLKSASVAYGRREPDADLDEDYRDEQTRVWVSYSEQDFTAPVESLHAWRGPLGCESRSYELTGYSASGPDGRFRASDFVTPKANGKGFDHVFDSELKYEEDPKGGKERRLLERSKTFFRPDDFGASSGDALALLPLGEAGARALPGESYTLALTPGLRKKVFQREREGQPPEDLLPNPADVLGPGADKGGHVDLDGDGCWWVPSGRVFFSAGPSDAPAVEEAAAKAHFMLPRRYRDPFHAAQAPTESLVVFDAYDLLLQETVDALGNRVTVGERHKDPKKPLVKKGQDYRVLAPALVMDPNRNRAAVAFDALGLVVGTAVMGKPEDQPAQGDSLEGFEADLVDAAVEAHLAAPLSVPHAVLRKATTRLVHDLFAYHRTRGQARPAAAVSYTLVRETHESDLKKDQNGQVVPTRVQHSFSYSDGFGREIQKKSQAEPGPVPKRGGDGRILLKDGFPELTGHDVAPRWLGSGWTVFNNKGKPARKYEPFFSDTHAFEFEVRVGLSPVVFYDPAERVVATLHPNKTWEKVVLGAWKQTTWDVNDTLLLDPLSDADVGAFFARLSPAEYKPTWHQLRTDGAYAAQAALRWPDQKDRDAEAAAAVKTRLHAGTPAAAHLDSLGRTYLTVTHNRTKYSNAPLQDPPAEAFDATLVSLDLRGHQLEVVDAGGAVVMRYAYDLQGGKIRALSADAGESVCLLDAAGKTIRAWDSRRNRTRLAYDRLRRPWRTFSKAGDADEIVTEATIYGEAHPDALALNLRQKYFRHYDGAGLVACLRNDFKGNALEISRRLAGAFEGVVDWSALAGLDDEAALAASPEGPLGADTLTTATSYDALDRAWSVTTPDKTTVERRYNEGGLLERVSARLGGAQQESVFVAGIAYDSKGQRLLVEYGNGVESRFEYDPQTHRLTRAETTRPAAAFPGDQPQPPLADWPGGRLQSLRYAYDPAGNLSGVRDDAQQTIFFKNKRVEPTTDYLYDATYRLIEASGREHLGQVGQAPAPYGDADVPLPPLPHPQDGRAMGRYLERYIYDAVGNLEELQHRGTDPSAPGWTRTYDYLEKSAIDENQVCNRLSATRAKNGASETHEPYTFDAHGNVLSMPHLKTMEWDAKDQLIMADRVGGGKVHFDYDANGNRVRKVLTDQEGVKLEERIYLGTYEIFRKFKADDGSVELQRESLHVMDDARRVALVETRTKGQDPSPKELTRYQLDNHLGSASVELDGSANIISYEEYYPYGSTSYRGVAQVTEVPKRYRFTGKERDEETGLYYHGARYYAPWLGRWTSVDPAGLLDGTAGYAYVKCNPVNLSDPSGHLSWGQWAGIGAAIVVGTVLTVATAGLAGPVVGTAAAAIIGGIVGGAAGGVAGEFVESKIDKREANYGRAALVGAVAGGVFAGAGAAVSAIARGGGGAVGAVARAAVSKVANSGLGQGVKALATKVSGSGAAQALKRAGQRVADSAVGRGVAKAGEKLAGGLEKIHNVAEKAGTAVAKKLPFTAAGKQVAAAARVDAIIATGGPSPQGRGVGAFVVDVPGYTGPAEVRALSGAASDALIDGSESVFHATVPAARTLPKITPKSGTPEAAISHINDVEVKALTEIAAGLPEGASGTIYFKTAKLLPGGGLGDLPACSGCQTQLLGIKGQFPGIDFISTAAPRPPMAVAGADLFGPEVMPAAALPLLPAAAGTTGRLVDIGLQ